MRTGEGDIDGEELVLGEVLNGVRDAAVAEQAGDFAVQGADAHVARAGEPGALRRLHEAAGHPQIRARPVHHHQQVRLRPWNSHLQEPTGILSSTPGLSTIISRCACANENSHLQEHQLSTQCLLWACPPSSAAPPAPSALRERQAMISFGHQSPMRDVYMAV